MSDYDTDDTGEYEVSPEYERSMEDLTPTASAGTTSSCGPRSPSPGDVAPARHLRPARPMSTIVPMTPTSTLTAALLCSLAAACGDSGPGEDGELPAAFTIVATVDAGMEGCLSADTWTVQVLDVRTSAPRFVGGSAPIDMGTCAPTMRDGNALILDCEMEGDTFGASTMFVVDLAGAGTVERTVFNVTSGAEFCSATYTITSFTDDTPSE